MTADLGPHALVRRPLTAAATILILARVCVLAVLMDWDDRRHGVTR